ncbi:UNVERIFIED_CONTAM: hypothetical protein RMT77_009546 [Armadillidium vulgare]
MIVEIILLTCITLILWNIFKKPADYPPGPWGLPLFGSIPFNVSKIETQLEELRKKHRTIFSWRIGSKLIVFLCQPKLIKEAFQSQVFSDRPDLILFTMLEGHKEKLGIGGSNGVRWHNNRRFTLRHLKDLGMGKSKIVSAVQYEATEFVKTMKKQAGTPAPVPEALNPAIFNVLWQMVASKRYEFDDEELLEIHHLVQETRENIAPMMIIDIFPWVKTILPEFFLNFFTKKDKHTNLAKLLEFKLTKLVDDHVETLDVNNSRDYIDEYLIEMEKKKDDPDSTMSIKDLVTCIADLLGAGLDTTSISITWGIFYLASFPEVQTKLQKEIDEVIPKGTLISLEHKSRLPYTEAFLAEVLRYSSLAAFGAFHSVSTDTKFSGYTIPKGSVVAPMYASVHFDPKYFPSPNEFKPERFLSSEGKFENPKEGFFPFGNGKRQCLGESLARMQLFIFLVTMVQELHFSPPPNKTLDLSPLDIPLFHQPKANQDILITIRS